MTNNQKTITKITDAINFEIYQKFYKLETENIDYLSSSNMWHSIYDIVCARVKDLIEDKLYEDNG